MEKQLTLGTREEKRAFYKYAFKITAPIALQNLMDTAVGSADVIMLSFVSQAAMAASSLAGQVMFVYEMLLYGLCSGASILCAQYWGKGDTRTVERVLGIALRIALIVGAIFTAAALIVPDLIMRIYTNDAELVAQGALYLRAVAFSYFLSGFCTIYLAVVRSVERVKLSAAVHSGAVVVNVVLNACFIFGIGPFPKLGIVGVALATTITRALECIVCLKDGLTGKVIRLRFKYLIAREHQLMKDFFRLTLPAMGNDIIWSLATSLYSVILGHLSADIVAANSVASVVRNWGTVVCFGVSSSAAIIMGKTLGENRKEEARVYAARFARMSVLTAVAGGLLIILCRPLILKFMYLYVTVTDTVRSEVSTMLFINAYYIIGVSVNTMLICGLFRAGGDARYGLICDALSMWAYAVPAGFICAFLLKIPEMWVYFVLCLDEFVKMPANIIHYKKKKWLNNITRDDI